MANKSERVYRVLFSAIAGSGLSTREIRWLVEEFSSRGEFIYKLQDGLWRLAEDLDVKFSRSPGSSYGNSAQGIFDIPDLIYDHVISKRMTKEELRSLLSQLAKGQDWPRESSSKLTVRRMIERFIDEAPPSAVSKLMDILGMEVEQDSYLIGIDKKSKRV